MRRYPVYIREWRLYRQVSQADLARRSGLTQCAISRIEQGDEDVRLSTLSALARALSMRLGELFSKPPIHFFKLDRYEIDAVARAVVSGERGLEPYLNSLADECAALLMNKLSAHKAPGCIRNRGKRFDTAKRAIRFKEQYGEELMRQVLNRVDKFLIVAA